MTTNYDAKKPKKKRKQTKQRQCFNINTCTWFVQTWLTIIKKMDFIKCPFVRPSVCECVFCLLYSRQECRVSLATPLRTIEIEPAKICQINIKLNQSIILLTWLFNVKNICWYSDLLTFTQGKKTQHTFTRWSRLYWFDQSLFGLTTGRAAVAAKLIALNVHVTINSCNLVSNLNKRIEFVPCFSLADYLLDTWMFLRAVLISFEVSEMTFFIYLNAHISLFLSFVRFGK